MFPILPFYIYIYIFTISRNKLDAALKAIQAEKQTAESTLSSFEILGQEFEALVEQYSQLRLEIENKRWALKEFSRHSH